MSDLKPCPFCGGGAQVNKFKRYPSEVYTYSISCGKNDVFVKTLECEDLGRAIEAWNTRKEGNLASE